MRIGICIITKLHFNTHNKRYYGRILNNVIKWKIVFIICHWCHLVQNICGLLVKCCEESTEFQTRARRTPVPSFVYSAAWKKILNGFDLFETGNWLYVKLVQFILILFQRKKICFWEKKNSNAKEYGNKNCFLVD